MASSVDPLSQLHDIHLPAAIGWWPLAIGWYLLAVLVLVLLGTTTYFLRQYYLNTRSRRQALRLLVSYEQTYQRDVNHQAAAASISELLKRVALVHFPREKVAGLQGIEWLAFLNDTSRGLDFKTVRYELLEAPYQSLVDVDMQGLFELSRQWINQRKTTKRG